MKYAFYFLVCSTLCASAYAAPAVPTGTVSVNNKIRAVTNSPMKLEVIPDIKDSSVHKEFLDFSNDELNVVVYKSDQSDVFGNGGVAIVSISKPDIPELKSIVPWFVKCYHEREGSTTCKGESSVVVDDYGTTLNDGASIKFSVKSSQ